MEARAGRRAGLCVAALVVLASCSSDENLTDPPTAPTARATVAAAPAPTSPPVATADAAAPAIDPATGTPAWCAALSASSALNGLPDAFRALADPATADSGRGVLAAAAADLQAVVPQTTGTVTDATNAVISSLNAVATNGFADQDATNTLSQTMIAFGSEVQTVCQFVLGG